MAGLNLSLFRIILCGAILNPSTCYGELREKEKEHDKLLFVFGDSLFDAGNNQYLNGSKKSGAGTSWPYGMNFNNHSTGRLSDGRIVPDFIALFAKLNMPPPFLQPSADFSDGANFASAGGGVLESNNGVMNLRVQLNNFKKVVSLMVEKLGKAKAKKVLMRSVYLISLGGNDYFSFNTYYPNATETERRDYMLMVIGNLTNGLKELYEMGVRKVGVQNVGPLGCYPIVKAMYPELNGSCVKRFLSLANQHNKALSNVLLKLEKQLPGFKHSILDYYHALADRINHPTKYGFEVGKVACCGSGLYNSRNCGGGNGTVPYNLCSDPNEYVLFDGAHHTQRTNQQLAQLFWSGPQTLTGPYNLNQLFAFD